VLWWVLGVDDLEETARRRGLPIATGVMEMANGTRSTFQTAGMSRYPLPFFVAYGPDHEARLRTWQARYREAGHACEPGGFTFVEVGGGPELLDAWLGDHGLPLRHAPGPSGISAVGIDAGGGEVVIR
jgi:hypothetical protein